MKNNIMIQSRSWYEDELGSYGNDDSIFVNLARGMYISSQSYHRGLAMVE
jgi:hypothetical protein